MQPLIPIPRCPPYTERHPDFLPPTVQPVLSDPGSWQSRLQRLMTNREARDSLHTFTPPHEVRQMQRRIHEDANVLARHPDFLKAAAAAGLAHEPNAPDARGRAFLHSDDAGAFAFFITAGRPSILEQAGLDKKLGAFQGAPLPSAATLKDRTYSYVRDAAEHYEIGLERQKQLAATRPAPAEQQTSEIYRSNLATAHEIVTLQPDAMKRLTTHLQNNCWQPGSRNTLAKLNEDAQAYAVYRATAQTFSDGEHAKMQHQQVMLGKVSDASLVQRRDAALDAQKPPAQARSRAFDSAAAIQ